MTLLLALMTATAAPVMVEEDITVIARQVQAVRLTLSRDPQGRVYCNLDQTSGNARVDEAVCRRAARCLPQRAVTAAWTDRCLADARRDVVRRWRRTR